jgi:ATP-dependent DNA helicase RecG
MDWNAPLTLLFKKNKTPKSAQLLIDYGIERISDLIWIFPLRVLTFPNIESFKQAEVGKPFSGRGVVEKVSKRPNFSRKGQFGSRLYNISAVVRDSLSEEKINLVWFNAYSNMVNKIEEIKEIEFFGNVSEWKNQKQIISPKLKSDETQNQIIEYPTINSVNGNQIKKILDKIPEFLWNDLKDSIPHEILKRRNLPSIGDSFKALHGKKEEIDFQIAKERIIYEEFFQEQLKIQARKHILKNRTSIKIEINEDIKNLYKIFPYELTECQKRSLDEIFLDLSSNQPMMRLLQGDVGCGKTTVAFLSMLAAYLAGFQSAMMCPTESLAQQHFLNFKKLFPNHPCKLLLGSTKEAEKKEIKNLLNSGDLKIIFGTHALISEGVNFFNPGLFIIDEQHKFGVDQRFEFLKRYPESNTLIMSATPIPRSLSLTKYGDLTLSKITLLPNNRKKIKTKIVTKKTFEQFLKFLNTRVSNGEQAYLVVPAIYESERSMYLENIFDKFKKWFPQHSVAFVHGQIPFGDRSNILKDFLEKKISILIATSVIEVGIDVKNATIMTIFSPELFGLSSLHQLRGRVGRGDKQSFCFLMALSEISKEAYDRLEVIEKSSDGFEISEKDLLIRGEGDHFGTNQSGIDNHRKLANIPEHELILLNARDDLEFLMNNGNKTILSEIQRLKEDLKILSTI